MDDFWAVVWGASIALIASIVGGLLTAVVGPALSRRAEAVTRREQRRTVADDEKRRVLRETVHDLDQALRLWVEAIGTSRQTDANEHRLEARKALVTLNLWITEEERAVADTALHVLTNREKWDAVLWYSAWSDTAASWFRGTTEPRDFQKQYEHYADESRPTVAKARDREVEAKGNKGT